MGVPQKTECDWDRKDEVGGDGMATPPVKVRRQPCTPKFKGWVGKGKGHQRGRETLLREAGDQDGREEGPHLRNRGMDERVLRRQGDV